MFQARFLNRNTHDSAFKVHVHRPLNPAFLAQATGLGSIHPCGCAQGRRVSAEVVVALMQQRILRVSAGVVVALMQ